MRHLQIATEQSTRADITTRLTGRFYTPFPIAETIATSLISFERTVRVVCDPFCGDGRLIVSWLRTVHRAKPDIIRKLQEVVLWDLDPTAVASATASVKKVLAECGATGCKVSSKAGDTFEFIQDRSRFSDLTITNPPWDLLKPDRRDCVSGEFRADYATAIKSYSDILAERFPEAVSKKGKAVTGYSVNLARAGCLAAIEATQIHGCLAIVLPASIFADQASYPFRRRIFTHSDVKLIHFYSAECRAFSTVDQAFVWLHSIQGIATDNIQLVTHATLADSTDNESLHAASLPEFSIPFGLTSSARQILSAFDEKFTPLKELQASGCLDIILGRELDETRIATAFSTEPGAIPFLKGRDVTRFRADTVPSVAIGLTARKIPSSVTTTRVAWRDVSRTSQKRRMQAALVPPGWVTGNSLGVAYFQNATPRKLRILLALFNSMMFEIQVRARLSTGHISQGVLRECLVPLAMFEENAASSRIDNAVKNLLASPQRDSEVEVAVARAYGLDADAMQEITNLFPKLTPSEKEDILNHRLWK